MAADANRADGVTRAPSLILQLMLGACLALVLSLSLIALAVDRGFRGAAEEALQERLESVVFLLLSTLEVDALGRPDVADSLAEPRLSQPGSGLAAGALTRSGAWQSSSLMGETDPPPRDLLARNSERILAPTDDHPWYRYAVGFGWEQPDGQIIDLTIWAAEDPARLRRTLAGFRGDLYRWMLLSAGLLILAQLIILLLVLRPLRRVADEVSEVESGQKTALDGRYPRELQPLTANLNALLATERSNATHYRQALADLAHALKTPLAVLRARLESAGRNGEGSDATGAGADLDETLSDMELILRRQLERAARSTRRTLNTPIAVLPVVQRLASSLSRLYAEKAVAFEVDGEEDLSLRIDERDLMELCGNLMENAAKYGHGRVAVKVEAGLSGPRSPGIALHIEDNGPGIAEARFEALLLRGVRGDQQGEGQGLGLAIARQLIEAYGGTIHLGRSPLGGAALKVTFPPR